MYVGYSWPQVLAGSAASGGAHVAVFCDAAFLVAVSDMGVAVWAAGQARVRLGQHVLSPQEREQWGRHVAAAWCSERACLAVLVSWCCWRRCSCVAAMWTTDAAAVALLPHPLRSSSTHCTGPHRPRTHRPPPPPNKTAPTPTDGGRVAAGLRPAHHQARGPAPPARQPALGRRRRPRRAGAGGAGRSGRVCQARLALPARGAAELPGV
jgi:hypothetical protein